MVAQKFTKYLYFEAYLAKYEASTYTKLTKDNCDTIAVINKRLGRGQTPFREDLKYGYVRFLCKHGGIYSTRSVVIKSCSPWR